MARKDNLSPNDESSPEEILSSSEYFSPTDKRSVEEIMGRARYHSPMDKRTLEGIMARSQHHLSLDDIRTLKEIMACSKYHSPDDERTLKQIMTHSEKFSVFQAPVYRDLLFYPSKYLSLDDIAVFKDRVGVGLKSYAGQWMKIGEDKELSLQEDVCFSPLVSPHHRPLFETIVPEVKEMYECRTDRKRKISSAINEFLSPPGSEPLEIQFVSDNGGRPRYSDLKPVVMDKEEV